MNAVAVILQLLAVLAWPHLLVAPPPASSSGGLEPAARAVPAAPAAPSKVRPESLGVAVSAKSALVADAASGTMLFTKASQEPHAVASLTKLVTALVVLERGVAFEKEITITADDRRGGSVEYFVPGEIVTVRDLWYAALVGSSNTATVALSRATGLSDADFAAAMNAKARALGMDEARFTEPTGLDEANRATAEDVLLLVRAAFAMDPIRQAVVRESYEVVPKNPKNTKRRIIASTDRLLGSFLDQEPYAIRGGKTGSLGDVVGYHLALSVAHERTNQVYVVVLGSTTPATRFADAKALALWAFETYAWPDQTALR